MIKGLKNIAITLKNKLHPVPNRIIVPQKLIFDGKEECPSNVGLCSIEETNSIISEAILTHTPFMVTRFGASELKTVNNFIANNISNYSGYNEEIMNELFTHSGVFPVEKEQFDNFCTEFIGSSREIDLIGVWNNRGEDILLRMLSPIAKRCRLRFLEPYFAESPWSGTLAGKKVLIIHPFEKTIRNQYEKREKLFENKNVLPVFELKTIKAVQSLSGEPNGFKNWTDAFNYLRNEISKTNFDVAIIGAGAYGLPLAAYVKKLGKIAIHLGGASQLLFGIKGKRWTEHPDFQKLFNKEWVYPLEEEKPEHGSRADGVGPYWW